MNLQEFAALKAGDVIENGITNSVGTVASCTAAGVNISWGVGPLFPYTVQSTAWFHWNKREAPTVDG